MYTKEELNKINHMISTDTEHNKEIDDKINLLLTEIEKLISSKVEVYDTIENRIFSSIAFLKDTKDIKTDYEAYQKLIKIGMLSENHNKSERYRR